MISPGNTSEPLHLQRLFSSQSTAAPLSQGGIGGRGIPEQHRPESPQALPPEVNPRPQDTFPAKAPQGGIRRAQTIRHLTGGQREIRHGWNSWWAVSGGP